MSAAELNLAGTERLLWSGAARPGVVFRPTDLFMVPFSVMWGGFAVVWEVMVIKSDAPFFAQLWGIPFVLIGLYFIFGRFVHDAWKRSRTTYAVTNERVIILNGRSEKSIPLRTLAEFTVKTRADGSGTIAFGSTPFGVWSSPGLSWPGMPQVPAFENIPDVRTVHELIRRAQKDAA